MEKMKIVFVPGCFDGFDGTQEELNELMAEIHRMVESGEILKQGERVDMDLLEVEDPELYNKITRSQADYEAGIERKTKMN